MNLTQHFTLAELTATDTGYDNTPTFNILANLKRLAETLEVVRILCGSKALRVSSGYRSEIVNQEVGGSLTSAHLRGEAADFTVKGLSNAEVFEIIKKSNINYDQLILEPSWIHLGLAAKARRENLIYNGKAYKRV